MIVSIKGNWNDAISLHGKYVCDRVEQYITHFSSDPNASSCTVVFLRELGGQIGVADFQSLVRTIPVYRAHLERCRSEDDRLAFRQNIEEVFDYESFCAKSSSGWNAYKLCKLSRTRTCPYCNQAFAFTVVNASSGRGFRPTLDHFLPKGEFPHLAISLNNLIPSCYTCNSNLKGKRDFDKHPHLHPLCDDESIRFTLEAPGSDWVELVSNFEAMKSHVYLKISYDEKCEKTNNSAKTFLIAERYEAHQDDAIEFASLRVIFDKDRIAELRTIGVETSEQQVLRFNRLRYAESILGKMYADIFDLFERD